MTRAARSLGNWTVSAGLFLRLLRDVGLTSLAARLGTRRCFIADLAGHLPAFMGARWAQSRKTGGLAAMSNCRVMLWAAKRTRLADLKNGRVKARPAARCARDAKFKNLLMPFGFDLGCC